MAESAVVFEARELVDRAGDLIAGMEAAPEQLSEVLALAEVAELSASTEGKMALAEAWSGLSRTLQAGGEIAELGSAWRRHGVTLSEAEEGSELHEEAWWTLRELLDLPAEWSLVGAGCDNTRAETEAQTFLTALEQEEVDALRGAAEEGEARGADEFGQPEVAVDAEAFLASVEGWLPPVEWPETGVLTEGFDRTDEGEITVVAQDVIEAEVEESKSMIEPTEVLIAPPDPLVEDEVPDEVVQAFIEEAREGFGIMESAIIRWEKAPSEEAESLREVFRLAHGIKGAANSVGWLPVGRVLHHLENALEDQVEGRIEEADAKSLSSLVLEVVDLLRAAVDAGVGSESAWAAETGAILVDSVVAWRRAAVVVEGKEKPDREPKSKRVEPESPPSLEVKSATERSTIRVEVGRLDGLMNLAGELVVNRHRLSEKLREVNALRSDLGLAHENFDRLLTEVGPRGAGRTTEGVADEVDGATLARALGEVAADARVLTGQIAQRLGSFSEEAFQFTRLTEELQSEVTQARMVPLDQVGQRLERAVRDATGVSGKRVNYVIEGGETRLDKLVLDHVFNSLLHLVRNAVAHGIEGAADRLAAGKPEVGKITVRGQAESGQITLEVSDDGAGLNAAKVLEAARRRGLVRDEETLSDEAVADLIFSPGLSTAESADSVAGRGIGLDAVRAEVTQLEGTVTVRSVVGVGTTFVLSLPLSLAVDRVILVQCGGQLLAVPLGSVEQVIELGEGRWEEQMGQEWWVPAQGEAMKACRVGQRLGLSRAGETQAVIVRMGETRVALGIDGVDQKRDVVVKPLGAVLGRHPCFSGALLTAEGRVVFVIDVERLLNLPALHSRPRVAERSSNPRQSADQQPRHRVLVVDDSPSLRLLTTRQLEGMGCEVVTANDGLQALERLRGARFDLVISDLEMPRLDGFGLLREMRADGRWLETPSVVVTTRESAEYRATAAELGVFEYLIKPLTVTRLAAVVGRALSIGATDSGKTNANAGCFPADAQPRNQS